MDSNKVSKFVTKNAPRLVMKGPRGEKPVANFDELELEQPVFEHRQQIPPCGDDETLEVCEPYRSAASEREGVAKNWRDTEEMSAKILGGCDVPVCGCQRRNQVKVCDFPCLLLVNTDGKPGASHTPAVVRSARSRVLPVLPLLHVFVGVRLLSINT
jgi:hypothetical protein